MLDQPVAASAEIRKASIYDIPALVTLRRRWTEEHGREAPDPDFSERFRAWFDDEVRHRTFWLAEADAAPIGMVNLFTFSRMPRPATATRGWGYLANMYVVPEHRGRGVGRYLLDALIAEAEAARLERIVLSPSEPSIPFYRRAGFDPADQLLLRPGGT